MIHGIVVNQRARGGLEADAGTGEASRGAVVGDHVVLDLAAGMSRGPGAEGRGADQCEECETSHEDGAQADEEGAGCTAFHGC